MENTEIQMDHIEETKENVVITEEAAEETPVQAEAVEAEQPAAQPTVTGKRTAGKFAKEKKPSEDGGMDGAKRAYGKAKQIIGTIVMILFHLRKVVMAIPVVYYALKIAGYNAVHLPAMVGLNLQANGEFAMQISRELAVIGPLAITGGCLALMFLCRKAMYSWAISIFTLALPIVILISNQYPA